MKLIHPSTLVFTSFLLLAPGVHAKAPSGSNGTLPASMPVTSVAFAGAHNGAMSTAEGWYYAQQSQTIEQLWDSGVRMIKVPIHWFTADKEGAVPTLSLCHEPGGEKNCRVTLLQRGGKDPQTAKSLFERIAKLLEANSKEVFVLKLENYMNKKTRANKNQNYTDAQILQIFINDLESSGLSKFAVSLQGRTTPLTLGEMRETNKRLIIIDDIADTFPGAPDYLNSAKELITQTHWDDKLMKDCILASKSSGGFVEMNVNPEMSVDGKSLAGAGVELLDKAGVKIPKVTANDYSKINSEQNINDRMKQCYEKQGVKPNFITSDYVNQGALAEVVDKINQERASQMGG